MPKVLPTADTANNILNRVAPEVGIEPIQDPWGSQDPAFVQMRALLNTAVEELAIDYPWQSLYRAHQITTAATDSGEYDLPNDFLYMVDQTGWERSQNVPLFGPLSAQDWHYLLGRDLVTSTIYASFRLAEGVFKVFPFPPPNGLDINFEYVSTNYVQDGNVPTTFKPLIQAGNDRPVYHRTLLSRYLKVKYYEAKGLDSTKAQDSLIQVFSFLTGQDHGAEILNAGRARSAFPYLHVYRNTPDSGYGQI